MEKNLKNNLLLDFYGNMLTDKQKEIMTLYFDCDSSLSEIADELHSTRQAVYDAVKSSERLLEETESKLKCVERFLANRSIITDCISTLDELCKERDNKKLQNVKKSLEKVLQNQ